MKLSHKILLLGLLPLLVGGVSIIIIGNNFTKRAYVENAEERANILLGRNVEKIDKFFQFHLNTLRVLAETRMLQSPQDNLPAIIDQLTRWAADMPHVNRCPSFCLTERFTTPSAMFSAWWTANISRL